MGPSGGSGLSNRWFRHFRHVLPACPVGDSGVSGKSFWHSRLVILACPAGKILACPSGDFDVSGGWFRGVDQVVPAFSAGDSVWFGRWEIGRASCRERG